MALRGRCPTRILAPPALSAVFLFTIGSAIALGQSKAGEPSKDMPQKNEATSTSLGAGQECSKCHDHDEILKTFALGVHGKTAKFTDGRGLSCGTCHGDAARHNETGNPSHIVNPPKLPAARANEMCLTCHAQDQTHATWRGSAHDRGDMSCVSCHNEHHPKSSEKMLSKRTDQELCLNCHKEKRKAVLQRSTHLFRTEHRDSKLSCASCHNAHGGEAPKLLQASSTNQLCYSCHAEKRAPVLWEHAPVKENCLTCHLSHGSNYPNLLKTRSSMLCQQCHMHMLWRHQTVAGFDIFSFNKGCSNCHSQVHGSNHPSGRAFTR